MAELDGATRKKKTSAEAGQGVASSLFKPSLDLSFLQVRVAWKSKAVAIPVEKF